MRNIGSLQWHMPRSGIYQAAHEQSVLTYNERRWPGLRIHVFFYIMWMAKCVSVAYPGKRGHQKAPWGKKPVFPKSTERPTHILI